MEIFNQKFVVICAENNEFLKIQTELVVLKPAQKN